jgi:Folylpolyglutamate synthase
LTICPMENVEIVELNDFGGVFNYRYNNKQYNNIEISLLGEHQVYNAALALTAVLMMRDRGDLNITDDEIRAGLKNTKWRGRLEVLRREPLFIIDGAHNLQGIRVLSKSLKTFKYNRLILGIAILKDKDVEHMIEKLTPTS